LLDNKQKEILSIYQASKAFISSQSITLFEEGIKNEEEIFPSKSQLLFKIKKYLSGSIGVEVILHELHAINSNDLVKATSIAKEMVEKFHMSNNANDLIQSVKNDLKSELSRDANEILRLKDIMIEHEAITKEDLLNA